MIMTDTKRMRSTRCALHLAGPALPWSGVAAYAKATPTQFGDRTPTPGPPRGTTG